MKLGTSVFITASIFWVALLVIWPTTTDPVPRADGARAHGESLYKTSLTEANFGIMGARIYQSQGKQPRWFIESEFAELHRPENYAFLKTVKADFTSAKSSNTVTAKSRFGRSHLDKRDVDLEGDVRIRSRSGYLFEMDKLHYDGSTHEFSTADTVNMKGPDVDKPKMLLKGTGLLANIDEEHFTLRNNVTAQRRLGKPNEWMKITSRSGEFFTGEQRSIFTKKVKAVLPTVGIESDRLELSLENEKESLNAQGNVVLKSRDRIGYANKALIEMGNNRIILEGKARVDAKDSQIRGKRITLYMDDDRVEVEEAEGKTQG